MHDPHYKRLPGTRAYDKLGGRKNKTFIEGRSKGIVSREIFEQGELSTSFFEQL